MKKPGAWLGLLVVLLVAVSCAGPAATPTPKPATPTVAIPTATPTRALPTATATPAARVPRGTVTVAWQTFTLETLEPGRGNTTTLNYSGYMYDFFVRGEPDGKLSNKYGVLDSWETSANADVYTLKLKKGIRWHDGTEMTAEDIDFTMHRYAAADAICTTCGVLKAGLDRVEMVDRYTARVYLKAPNVAFIPALSSSEGDLPILPKQQFEKVGAKGWNDDPMGSGLISS